MFKAAKCRWIVQLIKNIIVSKRMDKDIMESYRDKKEMQVTNYNVLSNELE